MLSLGTINPHINPDVFNKYSKINRLIVIGNGFDIAHGLKSGFGDFIESYCYDAIINFLGLLKYEDELLSINSDRPFSDASIAIKALTKKQAPLKIIELSKHSNIKLQWKSKFFNSICNDYLTNNWVDIEIKYFDFLKNFIIRDNQKSISKLNQDLEYLKSCFLSYLEKEINEKNIEPSSNVIKQFQEPIKLSDALTNTIKEEINPDRSCILNFNYTDIAEKYLSSLPNSNASYIPIHGQLNNKGTSIKQDPVFGFGDEMDEDYLKFELQKNDEVFTHIKSFKYLLYNHYRNLIEFIEDNPYQIHIYGHSCGLSDRTLLNTIFEHENCISIKPFYFEKEGKDDYEMKSYSIARHFKSKQKFRAVVANKQFCEPMSQPAKQ